MKIRIVLLGWIVSLTSVAVGCATPTSQPAPTFSPALAPTVELSAANAVITQQAVAAQGTVNAASWQATQQSLDSALKMQQFAATRTADARTVTYAATVQQFAAQTTANALAATATQEATRNAVALQTTQLQATRNRAAADLEITQSWATAEAARLAVVREQITNEFNAWGSRLLLSALGLVLVIIAILIANAIRLRSYRHSDALGQPVWYNGREVIRVYDNLTTVALAEATRDVQVAQHPNGEVVIDHRAPRALPAPRPDVAVEQAIANKPQLTLPDWQTFCFWQGWLKNELLLGISEQGWVTLNPERDPHLMIAGTSGAGKTRHGLTIVAASALRLGWHVIILNRAGADFAPLAIHPNLHIFDGNTYPSTILNAVAHEVDQRNEKLRVANVSTWERLANAESRVLVIVDELVALTQSAIESAQATAIWRAVLHITSAGRKCGLHLAFATTDPTYKTLGKLGLVARDNCARIAFRLRSEQAIMPGGRALNLETRHFLALTSAGNAPIYGAAFSPTDEELTKFAQQIISTKSDRRITFLENDFAEIAPTPNSNSLAAEAQRILLDKPDMSKRQLCQRLFGKDYAGSYAHKLDTLLAEVAVNQKETIQHAKEN